jgi:hypothetical protein
VEPLGDALEPDVNLGHSRTLPAELKAAVDNLVALQQPWGRAAVYPARAARCQHSSDVLLT